MAGLHRMKQTAIFRRLKGECDLNRCSTRVGRSFVPYQSVYQPPYPVCPGEMPQRSSGCGSLAGMAPAMAYVPWQQWSEPYEMEHGFCRGTIFPQLDLPFLCGGDR